MKSDLILSDELTQLSTLSTPPEANEWGYGRLLAILIRRRWWGLGIFVSVLLASLVLTLLAQPTYLSRLQVLVEPNYRARSGGRPSGESIEVDPQVQVDLTTQLQILNSTELLQKGVDRLLPLYPEQTVQALQANLQIAPVYDSGPDNKKVRTDILQMQYTDIDPEKTKLVLETLLSIYQAYNREQQEQRLARGLAFIEEQLPIVRQSVLDAETELQKFRNGSDTIDPQQQSRTVAAALETVEQQRAVLQAEAREAAASYQNLQQQLERSPRGANASARLSESSLYQSRLKQLQTLDLEITRQQQLLTPEHPLLQDLLQQREQQQQALEQEASRVLGTGSSSNQLTASGQLSNNELLLIRQLSEAQNQVLSLEARQQSLANREQQLQKELEKFPALIAQYERLQPEVELRRNTLQKLLDAKQDLSLEIARGGYKWEVVEEPTTGQQVSPSLVRNLLLGTVIGAFMSVVGSLLRESLDDSVLSPADIGNQLPIPLLGSVPELSNALDGHLLRGTAVENPVWETSSQLAPVLQWRPIRESLDLIYTNIRLMGRETPLDTLMITSALPGEGKTTISMGLAFSAARVDQRVLLIDADLRSPSLHQALDIHNKRGLSTLLLERPSVEEVLETPQWVYMKWEGAEDSADASLRSATILPSDISIDVLTAGPISEDPVKLLVSDYFNDLIKIYKQNYDLILVDTPPVLGFVDTINIGASCDGVIYVSRIGEVTFSDLKDSTQVLKRLNQVGVIANGDQFSPIKAGRYYSQKRG